jgi:integrase/recombinase XerD
MVRSHHEYPDSLVNHAITEGKITQDDADLIIEYMTEEGTRWSSPRTRYNVFYNLVVFRQYIGEYRLNRSRDLFEGIKKFKESGRKLTTVMQYLTTLKGFYLWLVDKGYSSIARDTLEHKVKIMNPDSMALTPESILTSDEITRLIKACRNSRDRAFVALLCDAGIKTKEACRLTWRQCTFDESGVYLTVREKTKTERQIHCVMAADYLISWRNDYPESAEGENPIFVTRPGNPFTDEWAFRLLGKIVKESGIKKPVRLHLLQHGKAKQRGADGNQERSIKKMLWRA